MLQLLISIWFIAYSIRIAVIIATCKNFTLSLSQKDIGILTWHAKFATVHILVQTLIMWMIHNIKCYLYFSMRSFTDKSFASKYSSLQNKISYLTLICVMFNKKFSHVHWIWLVKIPIVLLRNLSLKKSSYSTHISRSVDRKLQIKINQ